VTELRQHFPLGELLKVSGLARSTFYYQCGKLAADDKHAVLKVEIRAMFERHKGRYGYRRITSALRSQGRQINHKTVQRLMAELMLKSFVRIKKYRSYKGEVGRIAANLLARKFEAARPNEKWVTDVTEFNVGGCKLYLSPVMDLFNGEIIAYETARHPLFGMVSRMLSTAFGRLKPGDKPMLHSDQGWQYQMGKYGRALSMRGVTQSMSRRGNCLDNASMESFFGTLKSEYFHINKFACIEELEVGLVDYIRYYNCERIKLKLKGMSPVDYRETFAVS
jgi:putative transposase